MSIRSEAMSYRGDLSYELRELLSKNGMRAQLAVEQDHYKLLVQGHDSPMITYDISEKQFRALGDGGSNYANKKAYRTFNQIVGKDFDVPSSYVSARSVNSPSSSSVPSATVAATTPTRKPTGRSTRLSARTSTYPRPMSPPAASTAVWPWGSTATVSILTPFIPISFRQLTAGRFLAGLLPDSRACTSAAWRV